MLQVHSMAGCQIRHKPINAGRPNVTSNELLKQNLKKIESMRENRTKSVLYQCQIRSRNLVCVCVCVYVQVHCWCLKQSRSKSHPSRPRQQRERERAALGENKHRVTSQLRGDFSAALRCENTSCSRSEINCLLLLL